MDNTKSIGIMSFVNPRAAALVKNAIESQSGDAFVSFINDVENLFEPQTGSEFDLSDRKIVAFNEAERMADLGADLITIPDFKTGLFVEELQREILVPIIDINTAVTEFLLKTKKGSAIGVLDSQNIIPASKLGEHFKLFVPNQEEELLLNETREKVLGQYDDKALETLEVVCKRMIEDGVELIVPNNSRFALLQDKLMAKGFPILDVFSIFANSILIHPMKRMPKPFKLGLIGGLGPASTVDLYDKIVKATPAKNDQEHFKVVIEQNPQIDDRTACLLNGGADPTLAMYNCAKRLQKDGCDYAIIPCNTAHAFLPRLLRHLDMPFIDMQQTMLDSIKSKFGENAQVGLMATTGTLRTGIYSQKAEKMGIPIFVPDDEHQERVMSAIYGPKGAKAGFTTGQCYEDLYSAAEYLVKQYNCNVLILGCTELPLIFHEQDDFEVAGKKVAIVDPTATLARKCVEIAEATIKQRGVR